MFKDEYGKNTMTLQQATLPTPQFDQIQLAELKQQIEELLNRRNNLIKEMRLLLEDEMNFVKKFE